MEDKFLLLIFFLVVSKVSGQSINCDFAEEPRGATRLYSCNANIQNPNGADNLPITSTDGHLDFQEDEHVQMLNIVAGTSSIMPRVFCDQFFNLVVIEFLANLQMTTISAESFAGCTEIEEIFIRSNPIEVLPATVFIHNTYLKIFSLRDTQLTSLPTLLFEENQALQDVTIADNLQLSDIPSAFLSIIPQVKTINLSNNLLMTWDVEWFNSLVNLNQLIIDGNDLVSIPEGAFTTNLLTHLSINSCGIKRLESVSFGNLGSLIDLFIANNQMRYIDEEIFNQALSLTRLNATQNICIDANFDNFNHDEDLVQLQACFETSSTLNVSFSTAKFQRVTLPLSQTSIDVNVQVGAEAFVSFSDTEDGAIPKLQVVLGAFNNNKIFFMEDYRFIKEVSLHLPLSEFEEKAFHLYWDLELKKITVKYYAGGFPVILSHTWINALSDIKFITVNTNGLSASWRLVEHTAEE